MSLVIDNSIESFEKEEFNNLIANNKLQELLDICELDDLVNYRYQDKYLIEYLLENNIYNDKLTNQVIFNSNLIKYFLKYHVTKPLLKCHLKPLLESLDNKLLLDILLDEITDDDKMILYNSFKINSYWDYHDYEKVVIDSFLKHNIKLPSIFMDSTIINKSTIENENEIIKEFKETYRDQNKLVLNLLLVEIDNRLLVNKDRLLFDLRKLIDYKKNNPNFKIELSNNTEGEYSKEENHIIISPYRFGVLTHEISHLLYEEFDTNKEDDHFYEIKESINNSESIKKIIDYLNVFHKQYEDKKKDFEKEYYEIVNKKHYNYESYIKVVCQDIINNKVSMINDNDKTSVVFFIDEDNLVDIATEFLIIEKEEYVNNRLRNFYTEELMLENLLDSLLNGHLFDNFVDIKCLSGHSNLEFTKDSNLSFNECLANYDAIKNSNKSYLISDLENLVGKKLINYLDNYLVMNRGDKYGY